jgi:virginiamycin B lyase
MDDRLLDGNRIGRITPDGKVAECATPEPRRFAYQYRRWPGPDIWFTKQHKFGRITPQSAITEFEIPTPNSGPIGLIAGSDRRPPRPADQ